MTEPKAGQVWRSRERPDFKMKIIEVTATEIDVEVDRQKNNVRESRRLKWPRDVWRFHVGPYELESGGGRQHRKEGRAKT